MKNKSPYRAARTNRLSPFWIIAFSVLGAAFLTAAGLLIYQWTTNGSASSYRTRCEELESRLQDVSAELESFRTSAGPEKIAALQKELNEIKAQRDALENGSAVHDLKEQLEQLQVKCTALQNELNERNGTSPAALSAVSEIYARLCTLLSAPPEVRHTVSVTQPDGTTSVRRDTIDGWVSLYYYDIDSGTTFGFDEKTPHDSASLLKLPFALSLLSGNRVALNAEYTYNEATDRVEGTGIIIKAPDGKVYTHGELFEAMLCHSDCIAFNQLKNIYGLGELNKMVREKEWTSMTPSVNTMSAYDAGQIMLDAYAFMKTDTEAALLMKDAMEKSPFRYLIRSALPDRTAACKYGWDDGTFHEVALVGGEHPYVIAVMSNMDEATSAQCEYLCEIIRCIDALHEASYPAE